MIRKSELLIGTHEELLAYLKDEMKINSYKIRSGSCPDGIFSPAVYELANTKGTRFEMSEEATLAKQLDAIGVDDEGFSIITYFEVIQTGMGGSSLNIPEIELELKAIFVWKRSQTSEQMSEESKVQLEGKEKDES